MLISMLMLFAGAAHGQTVPTDLVKAIQEGDAKAMSAFFHQSLEINILEKDQMASKNHATRIMEDIWKQGLAARKDNLYDEAIERKWSEAWLFYSNTIRFASAMGGGGDYGVFADGRYHLSRTLLELED